MAEEEKVVEERQPFMSFSFNEDGEFDRYAGIYLHVPLKKPPTPEEIAIYVGTIKSFAETWRKIRGKLELAEAQRQNLAEPPPGSAGLRAPVQAPTEPPQDEAEGQPAAKPQENIRPAPKRPQRGTGPPSDKQCNAILAICHRLDGNTVQDFFAKHPDVELYENDEGELLPTWASLQALGSFKASKIIEALQKVE